ncbi:MAG: hypothetical protein QW376_07740 [Candidatus Caldarchaeum sp.]
MSQEESRATEMFGQYETVTVYDFSTGGVQDALDFMNTFHEFIMSDHGTSHEEKTVQRARYRRGRRGKLRGLHGVEYMKPLL